MDTRFGVKLMNDMILHILSAKACGDYQLELEFNDGTKKRVDIKNLLTGPVFEP